MLSQGTGAITFNGGSLDVRLSGGPNRSRDQKHSGEDRTVGTNKATSTRGSIGAYLLLVEINVDVELLKVLGIRERSSVVEQLIAYQQVAGSSPVVPYFLFLLSTLNNREKQEQWETIFVLQLAMISHQQLFDFLFTKQPSLHRVRVGQILHLVHELVVRLDSA